MAVACAAPQAGSAPGGIPTTAPPPSPAPTQSQPTLPPTLAPTLTPTSTPAATPTPDPFLPYTIEFLRSRTYGGGTFEIVETLGDNGRFTRHLVEYDSDGLRIHGFINVPHGNGPFPVVIALHGYIDPAIYNTFDYTTRYADSLADAGFLVIHPNLRGYQPSDDGDNLFRVGMATDVLNLIGLVKTQAATQGSPLQWADPGRIGLWGHSMGGGISTRVITVSPDVKAAVLYGAMSGDERKNYEAIQLWSDGQRGMEELSVPDEDLARISPEFSFDGITAAVSIHHGTGDATVPVDWSRQTCDLLQALGKQVDCHFYDSAPHTFNGEPDAQFIQNVIAFFNTYLGQ
jgi:dipeptidyl aminopeptidase/acylaminoacyl peptidase